MIFQRTKRWKILNSWFDRKIWRNFSKNKKEIETINGGKELFYEKNYARIGVNTDDDDIPLNKKLKFPSLTTIIRCVFQNGNKLQPQVYLDECLYKL